jgi:hypothetical protein
LRLRSQGKTRNQAAFVDDTRGQNNHRDQLIVVVSLLS